jgi:hypothetical protein
MGPATAIAVVARFASAAVASGQALRRGEVQEGYARHGGYCQADVRLLRVVVGIGVEQSCEIERVAGNAAPHAGHAVSGEAGDPARNFAGSIGTQQALASLHAQCLCHPPGADQLDEPQANTEPAKRFGEIVGRAARTWSALQNGRVTFRADYV